MFLLVLGSSLVTEASQLSTEIGSGSFETPTDEANATGKNVPRMNDNTGSSELTNENDKDETGSGRSLGEKGNGSTTIVAVVVVLIVLVGVGVGYWVYSKKKKSGAGDTEFQKVAVVPLEVDIKEEAFKDQEDKKDQKNLE